MDRYRFILGAIMVFSILALAGAIALGHVEEKTSFGLGAVLSIVGKLALDFSEWAFRNRKENEGDKPNGG